MRYLYLNAFIQKKIKRVESQTKRVLVFGDLDPTTNHQMMSWLEVAASNVPSNTVYIIKSHPGCLIDIKKYSSLSSQLTNASLVTLLAECDVVFASNTTSAVVEAYSVNLPVIQVLDGNTFNMSPLLGMRGVVYVTNPLELTTALQCAQRREDGDTAPYFCLDSGLLRWQKLLGFEMILDKING